MNYRTGTNEAMEFSIRFNFIAIIDILYSVQNINKNTSIDIFKTNSKNNSDHTVNKSHHINHNNGTSYFLTLFPS